MNSRLLPATLLLGLGLFLTGCSTFNDTELGLIRGSGVSSRLYTKMERGDALTPEDVIELHRRHVPDRYALRAIDDAGVDYVLSKPDFKKLQNARVSPPVIDALVAASQEFSERYASPSRRMYYYGAGGYPYDDLDYGPGYYPYGTIGIGITGGRYWGDSGHRHHHHH